MGYSPLSPFDESHSKSSKSLLVVGTTTQSATYNTYTLPAYTLVILFTTIYLLANTNLYNTI